MAVAVGGRRKPADFRRDRRVEELVRVHRDSHRERLTIGEMGVGALTATPSAPFASARERPAYAPLADDLNHGIDQRCPQVTIVVTRPPDCGHLRSLVPLGSGRARECG